MNINLEELDEQEAIRFSKELLSLYFEKRDMNTLAGYIAECVSWIGAVDGELCGNGEEAAALLAKKFLEYSDCYTIVTIDFHFTPLSAKGGVIYGTIRAMPHDSALPEQNICLSAVMENARDGMRLLHLHFSRAEIEPEPGHCFAKKAAWTDNRSLRAELRERQLANLTKNIPGGVYQCANDPDMTLLSMSDGFLSMFGYTKEDIETQFEGKFMNMVYPDDRGDRIKAAYAQLEKGTALELEYRVLRKVGQPVWVLHRGRLIDDENGGTCFYCILIDITERKRQQEELRLSLERHKVILDQAADNISTVMKNARDGMKLMQLHYSRAEIEQEPRYCFAKKTARTDNGSLRAELNMRERQLANLTKNIPGGAHQCANDPNMTLLSMSDGFLSMFGYTKEEIETQFEGKFMNMVYPGDRAEMIKATYAQLEKGTELELEYRVLRKVGQPVWVLDKGRLIDDENGGTCFYCILIDITERKRQQEELRLSLERHKVILDQATDIIFEWDILRDTLTFSPNWKKRFGYDAIDTQISGRIPLSQNIHPEDMPAFVKIMKDTAAGAPYSETEFRIRDLAGEYYWSRIRVTAQYNDDGCPIQAVGVIVDIDEEKKQKQELIQQAHYDVLTGIYNKATINALVEQRMQGKYKQGCGLPDYHALLIIDVDFFKTVNDTYGHLCGDSVLSDVAAALKGSVRSSDLVGRIGGDEFLVYLPDVSEESFVRHKTEQLMQALSYIRPEAGAPPITCSIGAAVFSRSQSEYETLYQAADCALYLQKNSGRNGFSFYEPDMGEIASVQSVTAVGNAIVSDEGNVADEWLAQYAFRALYEAKDTEAALNRLLEIIGRSFDVSRAYIFENSEDGTHCSNTFEWCGDGVIPQMDALQDIAYVDGLCAYHKNFNEHGIFYCHGIESLNPVVFETLKPQGVRSMLQCAMLDEGAFVGYVGFDECRENREWNERQIATFKLTADVLSTFLMKLREKQKRRNHNK